MLEWTDGIVIQARIWKDMDCRVFAHCDTGPGTPMLLCVCCHLCACRPLVSMGGAPIINGHGSVRRWRWSIYCHKSLLSAVIYLEINQAVQMHYIT
jgi:hypothetical protein